jgi:hypothetical protein
MKYIIPQDKIDNIIFKYLDMNLKGLEKRKPKDWEGIVFYYPDEEHGILAWENDGTLFMYNKLVDEIDSTFGLNRDDSESIIGRWVSDRHQLEVLNTLIKHR